MKGTFSDFIAWHADEAASDVRKAHHAERALSLLFRTHAATLAPHFDAYGNMGEIHKSFRQTDVTDSGELDMVFWHLMHASNLVWEWETEGYDDFMAFKRRRDRIAADAKPSGSET